MLYTFNVIHEGILRKERWGEGKDGPLVILPGGGGKDGGTGRRATGIT